MKINIETIPHQLQRYETSGDWWYDPDGTLQIRVSRMSNWRYDFLVAVHELVEAFLCRHAGVTQEEVDNFDTAFEGCRQPGNTDEPGDAPLAPYRVQHCVATGVERIIAALLGVVWKDYEIAINSL